MITIYVKLVNELVEVWRPVDAVAAVPGTCLIVDQKIPDEEKWEFEPGSFVKVELRNSSIGECLTAVALAPEWQPKS